MQDVTQTGAPTLALVRSALRPWRERDAETLVQHANNERVSAAMRDIFPFPYTIEHARAWVHAALHERRDWLLAIERDGQAVGGIALIFNDDVYRLGGEIGYWLAEPLWGRGVMTEAVSALAAAAFARTDLIRLQAGVFSINPASMRVLQKAGFHLESIRRQAVLKRGVICDEHIYCRLRDETA